MTDDDKSFVSATEYTAFDIIGRVTGSKQVTDGVSYETGYVYNLAGAVVEETYPSGRKVKNTLDASGDLSMVQSGKCLDAALGTNAACINAAGLWSYARHFSYNAAGAVTGLQLGNGLWESAQFNSRLQPTQIALGATQGATNLLKLDYSYGMTNNNGNVLSQTITVPTVGESSGFVAVQTYNYDSLNRLTEAKETTGAQETWKQTFGYDRYGNRTQFSQTIGGIVTPNTNINHPSIDQTNNRFTTGQGYVYDFNGNIVQDAEGRTFTFNGDDKQTEVRDTATNQIIGQYFYDGSGARVKKVVPSTGETTVFVYDAGGALAAEYSTQVETANPTTSYLTIDHLGSPRVITDGQGNVISRRDFMPFGEEIGVGVGPRTEALKYSHTDSDNIRKRFTGYEKDEETGLDFAEARMYESRHGRFTAVDPLLASASAANPQTFNRYIYTGNNPINFTDPSGLKHCRAANGTPYWTKNGADCNQGDEVLDGQAREVSGGGCYRGKCANVGDVVLFNADGTTTVIRNPTPEQRAIGQARIVVDATVEVTGSTAADVATSGSGMVTTAAEVSSNITPRGLLPLPCLGGEGSCGAEPVYSNPLTPSPDAPGLKTVEGIIRLAEGCSLIPGLGVPCGIIAAIGRAGQGDAWGAGENLLNIAPFLGIARKANKAASVGRTFGERLFLSERFGITSDRFANSATLVTGTWNKPKSWLKIGWSSTGKKGGGMQLRIGIGKGEGSKAWGHIYIPKTFVPNSFANPSIEVKRSLFHLGQRL